MMDKCSVMQNGFQVASGEDRCITFLFQSWSVDSHLKYAFMLVGVFLMGITNGLLVYLRHRVILHYKRSKSFFINQLLLSLLYGIQIVLAYWIMLLVMTYETGLFIVLIGGLVVGYFIFGYIQARQADSLNKPTSEGIAFYQKQFDSTPCCQTTTA